MTITKGLVRLGAAVGLFALVLSLSAAFASTTNAQGPPATMYGSQSPAADHVGHIFEAFIGGVSCGTAAVDSDGFWMMQIGEDAACSPSDGDEISFTHNGDALEATETWASGGAPADVANGVSDTLGMGDAGGVTVPDTGNAGLLTQSSGTSPWLALALGALALGALAGTRAVARRS